MSDSEMVNRQILHKMLKAADEDDEFVEIEDQRKKFLCAMAVLGGEDYQSEACKLADLSYNSRARRNSMGTGLWDEYSEYLLSLAKGLRSQFKGLDVRPKIRGDIMDVLDTIIHGNARDSDKVRAIESKAKLEEKREGSSTLKPFERIWLEVIGPNLLGKNMKITSPDDVE